jgi:FkbM family methyltransferase
MNYNKFFPNIPDTIKTVFEVGAKDCKDSITLSSHFNQATIYSYEPNPFMEQVCREAVKNNCRIVFLNYGLADKDDIREFFVFAPSKQIDPLSIGASSFYKRTDYEKNQIPLPQKLYLSTIDLECKKFNIDSIDLLCMDVQGYELFVLQGALDILKSIKYIILEEPKTNEIKRSNEFKTGIIDEPYIGCPDAEQIINFLNKHGFYEIARYEENLFEDNVLYKRI